ncbi:MAG: NAD(P)-binding domain-containing protein [Candidatus Tectimicrobiota bacterium]
MVQLAYIGGLGLMAGPAGTHLKADGPARVLRVHDRGTPGAQKDAFRSAWQAHGAALVPTLDATIGDGKLDGVVVCCGKNGDDVSIIAELTRLLQARCTTRPFIVHMSTVSAGFTSAALAFCQAHGVDYVNYPLTGGPLGAQLGGGHPNGMLILASGDQALYARLEPTLKVLGRPKNFGPSVSAGAETKLIGQHLVFDGCTGICTGAALYAECFANGTMGGPQQAEYFDFLNGGAGGTRQWDVALSKGVKENDWSTGFNVRHAVVDAIYAAKLAQEKGLPRFSIQPMLNITLAFAFVLRKHPNVSTATHAIARELVASAARELDAFMDEHGAYAPAVDTCLNHCIAALPPAVQQTVLLDINEANFAA